MSAPLGTGMDLLGGRGFNWCCQMQHRHSGSSWCGSRALKCFPSPTPCRVGLLFTLEKIWTQFLLQQMLIFKICGEEHLFLWEGGGINQLSSLNFLCWVGDAVVPTPLVTIPVSVCRVWVGTRRRQHSQDHQGFFRLHHHPELCSSVTAIISL